MLHPILRTVVKIAVASLVVGTILAYFGITTERLLRQFDLSAARPQQRIDFRGNSERDISVGR